MATARIVAFGIVFSVFIALADRIVTDSAFGYSIYLPRDSWIRVVADSNHHQFYDSTCAFRSQISIVRHPYSPAVFPASQDWTRAAFIAYKLVVEYSVDPFGAMIYYDTSRYVTQDSLWATESYATFFSLDTTIGAWSEFTRYTATGRYGYELYAIGDTADMKKNIGTYAALVSLVKLRNLSAGTRPIRPPARTSAFTRKEFASGLAFDLLGRRLGTSVLNRSAGLRIAIRRLPKNGVITHLRGE